MGGEGGDRTRKRDPQDLDPTFDLRQCPVEGCQNSGYTPYFYPLEDGRRAAV